METFSTIKFIVTYAALAGLGLMVVGALCGYGLKQFKRQGFLFTLIAAGFLQSMATKPSGPSVTFDDYLKDNGTCYATNGVTKVGVEFHWQKTNAALPNTQPLYISRQATNDTAWVLSATTTVGANTYTLTLASPDEYRYLVWHEWVPPTPVHTNGVWLGTILEKAVDSEHVEKILVIQGELNHNGRKLNK